MISAASVTHDTKMSKHLGIPVDAFAVQYTIKGQAKKHLRLTFGGALDCMEQLRPMANDGTLHDLNIIDHCGRRLFTCIVSPASAFKVAP